MMVEVFRTDVDQPGHARMLLNHIHQQFDGYRANFDLEDCDRILRIHSPSGEIATPVVLQLLREWGFNAEVLPG